MIRLTSLAFAVLCGFYGNASLAQSSGLRVTDALKIGGDGGWDYISFDPGRQTLYMAHGSFISAVDLKTGLASPHLADAKGAHIALPVHGGLDLLITQGKADSVTINDATTGAVKAEIRTDAKPDAAIVEPVTGLAFVMANKGGALDAIDLTTSTLAGRVDVGGAAESGAVDGQGLVFTHLEDRNAFVTVDARTLKIVATHPLDDCEEPSGMAFVPNGRLILSACQNGIARVSNADTGAEVATLPVGAGPDAALYDASTNQGYIPSRDGKLTVISFAGVPHVIDTVTTGSGARTATLDTATGRIYLPTAEFGPEDPKTGKPNILPGTFKVLVVGR